MAMGIVASAGTFPTFGPKTYVRGAGDPGMVTDTFSVLNSHVPYTLRVVNSVAPKREDRDDRDGKDQDQRDDKNKDGSGGESRDGDGRIGIDKDGGRDDRDGEVSSAIITINGVRVLGPDDFKGAVRVLNVPLRLLASNQIGVEILGERGGTLATDGRFFRSISAPTGNKELRIY